LGRGISFLCFDGVYPPVQWRVSVGEEGARHCCSLFFPFSGVLGIPRSWGAPSGRPVRVKGLSLLWNFASMGMKVPDVEVVEGCGQFMRLCSSPFRLPISGFDFRNKSFHHQRHQ